MYNYFPGLIWQLNKVLLAFSLFFSLFVIFFSAVKEAFTRRRNRNMLLIKAKLEDAAFSKTGRIEDRCNLTLGKIKPLEILKILRDKELFLSKEAQQELTACFVTEDKLVEIQKIARNPRGKWRRIQAIISLGYSDDPGSLKILNDSLGDKDEDVSYFSMVSLGHIKTIPAAKSLLIFLSKHTHSGYKIASLLEAFPSSVVKEVIDITYDPDPQVRFWGIKIISKFRPDSYLERIIGLTEDRSDDVRAAACECLGEMGLPQAKDALINRLKDKAWFVRMHAARALHKILSGDCIPLVLTLLGDENWLVRDTIKKAMADNIEKSFPFIEKLILEDNEVLKKDCVDVLEVSGYLTNLINNIFSENTEKRQISVRILNSFVRLSAHSGLEVVIKGLGEERQKVILAIISQIDRDLAQHIEKAIKGEPVEV